MSGKYTLPLFVFLSLLFVGCPSKGPEANPKKSGAAVTDSTEKNPRGVVHKTKPYDEKTQRDIDSLLAHMADAYKRSDSRRPRTTASRYFMLKRESQRTARAWPSVEPTAYSLNLFQENKWFLSGFDDWMDLLNLYYRARRDEAYEDQIKLYPDCPVLVTEGDSWFQFPVDQVQEAVGEEKVDDVVDHLSKSFPIKSFDNAGHTAEKMADELEFKNFVDQGKGSVLIISAGGNDILGDPLDDVLVENPAGGSNPSNYIDSVVYSNLLDGVMSNYAILVQSIDSNFPVLIHCYGYMQPGNVPENPVTAEILEAKILPVLIDKKILDGALQMAVVRLLTDHLADRLKQFAQDFANVHLINVLQEIDADPDAHWFDEIHPTTDGAKILADAIVQHLSTHGPTGSPCPPDPPNP